MDFSSETTIYINPSLSQSHPYCDDDSCQTLSQFAANTNKYINHVDTRLTLYVFGGNHVLDTSINLTHILEFSLLSTNDSKCRSTVVCNNSANFSLTNITQVRMHGLAFHRCGGNTIQSVSQLNIENSTFCGANDSTTSLTLIESKANLTTTMFLSNVLGTLTYRNNADILIHLGSTLRLGTFSVSYGGALITTHSNLVIMYCHFENNMANFGGAIYANVQSNITIKSSTFTLNKAIGNSLGFGGALFIVESSYIIIHNSTFINNTAEQYGGIAAIINVSTSFSNSRSDVNVYHNKLTDRGKWTRLQSGASTLVFKDTMVY